MDDAEILNLGGGGRVLENIAFGPAIPQMRNDLNGDWIVAAGSEVDSASADVLTIHPFGQVLGLPAIETAIFVALASGSSSPPSIGSGDV